MDTLTKEQRAVFNHLLGGDNLFLTGGGGVGKSYLLSVLCDELPQWKKQWEGRASFPIQLCAMTGCAALLLGHRAKTLHSWSGVGLGKGTARELFVKIRRNGRAMRNWLSVEMLVIDEVSMMTAELLDKLNALAKMIRKTQKPFGGIQLLLVGDFYQLPPIRKGGEEGPLYAFESESWTEVAPFAYELTAIMRQKDEHFQRVLIEARRGELTAESCAILKERWEGHNWRAGKIRPTLLFPRRAEVDLINDTNFRELKGRKERYEVKTVFNGKAPIGFDERDELYLRALQQFDSDAPYVADLSLVEAAQVMLLANMDPSVGLVNGSRGVIVSFCPATGNPVVEFMNGRRDVIGRHTWPMEDYPFVSRSQIPLRLAYALTIHKAQGASLDCALVDIGSGNFEFGQAYVALSRVRSLEALYVYDFEPRVFQAHSKVKDFYSTLHVLDIDALQEAPAPSAPSAPSTPALSGKIIVHRLGAEEEDEKESKEAVAVEVEVEVEEKAKEEADPGSNWLYESIPADWKAHMSGCEATLAKLSTTLDGTTFLPARHQIWASLEATPLESVRVVLLGQDPYPTPGHANGLSFSVASGKALPPSLQNIYKELSTDLGCDMPRDGDLSTWAKQGVLLLNTVLTVEAGKSQSHAKLGWETITDQLLRVLAERSEPIFFVLWGKSAQTKKRIILESAFAGKTPHRIHESAHPSPLSAYKGFFGTRPFSAIQQWLKEIGKDCIQWYKE